MAVNTKKKKKKTNTAKGVDAFYTTARARGSKVSSAYCTASPLCRRFLVSVLTTIQE